LLKNYLFLKLNCQTLQFFRALNGKFFPFTLYGMNFTSSVEVAIRINSFWHSSNVSICC